MNGVEITIGEINEEARARGLAVESDRPLRDALLSELVDRKLLVAEAERQGFDRRPQYLIAKRRSNEILLGQQLLADSAQAWVPSAEEVKRYIAANPHVFDARSSVLVDALALPIATPPRARQLLASARSAEQMDQALAQVGVKDARQKQSWDSALLPADWARKLLRLQPGEAFFLPSADRLIAGVVVARVPQPIPPAQRLAAAREGLDRLRRETILKRLVDVQRRKAEISFQPEFAPRAK